MVGGAHREVRVVRERAVQAPLSLQLLAPLTLGLLLLLRRGLVVPQPCTLVVVLDLGDRSARQSLLEAQDLQAARKV